jgi:aminomethyltransferase
MGVMACSLSGIDKFRVEAALLFYPYDMTKATTPWEVGFGWAVSRKKGDFRGKEAVFAREGQDKIALVGIEAEHDDIVDAGASLSLEGRKVGVVNSPAYSHRMKKSLGLAHVEPSVAAAGTKLELAGETVSCAATIVPIPFYDPQKTRPHTG